MKKKLLHFKNLFVRGYASIGLYLLKFLQKYYLLIAMGLVTIISMVACYMMVEHPTNDSAGIVLNWLEQIRKIGFQNFYKVEVDYSPIFVFMLACFSLLPAGNKISVNGYTFYRNDMIYLKSVYYVFIIAMAIGVYLLVKELTSSKPKAAFGYIATMVLPTVFLNSAIWGNSDVVLGAFFVFAFYFIVTKRERLAMICIGFALANKLQAFFIFPFIFLLIFNRKIKFYKLIYMFLALFVTFIPSYICGAPFGQPFEFITIMIGRFKALTLGCANFWHLIDARGIILRDQSVWIALAIIFATLVGVYYRGIDLDNKHNLFKVGVFLIMTTIFFLPHMHERYFYVIDVLVIVYALIDKKKFYLVPVMQLSSLIAYFHYLAGYYFIDSWGEASVNIAAFINLAVLIIFFYDVMKMDHENGFIKRGKLIDAELESLKEEKAEDDEPPKE